MHDDRLSSLVSTGVTDHSLVRRLRLGEEDAATQLYLRYARRLRSLAAAQTSAQLKPRFDEEDVVQSVFRTFFRRVTVGLYDVPPGEELWHLLLVLALNKIRKLATHHQAKKRDVRRTGLAEQSDGSLHATSGDEESLHMLRLVIDEMLQELPETHRVIIERRIAGYQAEEISQEVARSKRTVERVLQEFRQKLSRLIDSN
ncbi:MAG: sigma-70 family RNA polymerase sigma factor [Planctomycetales bacterium]|nr:sigma-70 family RNA polymerase sigma factor [Planctomycetales bacterium]MCA9168614.1 sigma-70 family RNA polymerase sigma factor [Planctomycetales bacterium]